MKLRCGVAGLRRGKQFVETLAATSGCKVVAACDPDPAAFEGLSGLDTFTDYDEFLDQKLDVVAVISPGPVHAEQSLKAMERGAHVLCETPNVYSLDEARAVVKMVRKTGLKYMLAENVPWMGWAVGLRRLAQDGKFGDIVYAEGDYTHDCRDLMLVDEGGYVPYAERSKHPKAKKTWRATDLPPLKYCSHTLGPLLMTMGDRAVSAYGLAIRDKVAPGLASVDLESALLSTEKGSAIRLTNGFCVAHPYAQFFKLVGSRGSAVILNAAGLTAKWYSEAGPKAGTWQDFTPEMLARPDGRGDVEVMVEEFIESVRKDTKPPLDVYESLDMVVPGLVAHESAMQGGKVLKVPDMRKRF